MIEKATKQVKEFLNKYKNIEQISAITEDTDYCYFEVKGKCVGKVYTPTNNMTIYYNSVIVKCDISEKDFIIEFKKQLEINMDQRI